LPLAIALQNVYISRSVVVRIPTSPKQSPDKISLLLSWFCSCIKNIKVQVSQLLNLNAQKKKFFTANMQSDVKLDIGLLHQWIYFSC
jgi:hypothetical protein